MQTRDGFAAGEQTLVAWLGVTALIYNRYQHCEHRESKYDLGSIVKVVLPSCVFVDGSQVF